MKTYQEFLDERRAAWEAYVAAQHAVTGDDGPTFEEWLSASLLEMQNALQALHRACDKYSYYDNLLEDHEDGRAVALGVRWYVEMALGYQCLQ